MTSKKLVLHCIMQGPSSRRVELEYIFQPRSIAVVGVSGSLTRLNVGRRFLKSLLNCEYSGKIYPVGRGGGKVFGLEIRPSIKDIPGLVDHVILAIPARHVPQLLADCAAKGTKVVHVFTAGFSESGDEEGKQLESHITDIGHRLGVRIIGPNCMGLYCPKTGLSFAEDLPKQSGFVGFISQSGGNSGYTVKEGAGRGIFFSKVISYGNACDLNESDFLEYLTADPDTKIITSYIEGVKDGRRFFNALTKAAKTKPVIVYKGGLTETGGRAVASHTGSIAGSDIIWRGLLKQAGTIQVSTIEEIIDIALLFKSMSAPRGKNIAIIGLGGGTSVLAADSCSSAGLSVPQFPPEMTQKLADICSTIEAGSSYKNPVDMFGETPPDQIREVIRTVANDRQIDLLLIHAAFGLLGGDTLSLIVKRFVETVISLAQEISNRTAVILHQIVTAQGEEVALEMKQLLSQAGFPVYPSIDRAANAISKFIQYYHNKEPN